MLYNFQVEEPIESNLLDPSFKTEYHYYVELGPKFTEHSIPLQKRFVRHLAQEHFGHPVKNPTQKIYVHDSVFTVTEKKDGKWHVVISTTNSGARHARLGRLGILYDRRGKTIPKG